MRGQAPHPAELPVERLLAACELRFTRRTGPGGQHRNKVESAVVITHVATGLQAEANERRSQHENRRVAIFRLRINLALNVRVNRAADSPTLLWQQRCRGRHVKVNPSHDDFPAILAEVLDVLAAHEMDAKQAADMLDVSTSQLVKLLKTEQRALQLVNVKRREQALHPLR